MTFIDTHAHFYLEEFKEDLPVVIERARLAGVSKILLPNIDSSTTEAMLRVCSDYPDLCYPMMGLHPTSVTASVKEQLSTLESALLADSRYIAIGEIGIDLYWDKTYLDEQIEAFDFQIRLALKYDLPIVVHSRDAFEHIYKVLLPYQNTPLRGVFHSFSATFEETERLLEFERFKFGLNGIVTFRNSKLKGPLQIVPLRRVVLETDAPYLAPAPFRGRRNESGYLIYTLAKIANIYRVPLEFVARLTSENTYEVFERLKESKGDFKVY